MFPLINFIQNIKQKRTFQMNKASLTKEIHKTVSKLAQTDLWFQMEENENLIKSCVYQRNLLINKYQNLLSQAKIYNIKINPSYLINPTKGE